jgi:hypothetical protein
MANPDTFVEPPLDSERTPFPWGWVLWVAATLLLFLGMVWLLFKFSGPSQPLIAGDPPEVKVKRWQDWKAKEELNASSYGVINKDANVYRIPVEKGISIILEEAAANQGMRKPFRSVSDAPAKKDEKKDEKKDDKAAPKADGKDAPPATPKADGKADAKADGQAPPKDAKKD